MNLAGVDLSNVNLRDVTFEGVDLTSTILLNAEFSGVAIRNSNISGLALGGNDLAYAVLRGSNLVDTDFTEANLAFADLADTDIRGARFDGANLVGATLFGALWLAAGSPAPSFIGAAYSLNSVDELGNAVADTIFPEFFDPVAAGMILLGVTEPPPAPTNSTKVISQQSEPSSSCRYDTWLVPPPREASNCSRRVPSFSTKKSETLVATGSPAWVPNGAGVPWGRPPNGMFRCSERSNGARSQARMYGGSLVVKYTNRSSPSA